MKNFAEKLKTDKKMRTAVISTCVGAVIVIATAIVVPVTLHNRPPVEQDAAQVAVSNDLSTEEDTTVASKPETEEITAEATEQITDAPTVPAEKSTAKAKPSGSTGANGTSAQKPSNDVENKAPAKPQEKTPETTLPQKKQWTQAEVDALVAEMKAYAKNRGFIIDSALTTVGTSWRSPSVTESAEDKIRSQLKYHIDESYDSVVDSLGYFPENMATINIVTQQYMDSDGYTQWEIYVVY